MTGKIVESGETSMLLDSPSNDYTVELLESVY